MSEASNQFEKLVADSINRFKSYGIKAARIGGDTGFPDVRISMDGLTSCLEAKMNHTDNLLNCRVFYDGSAWDTTYLTPGANYCIGVLNSSPDAAKFIRLLKKFLGRKKVVIPTTLSGLRNPDAVQVDELRAFVDADPSESGWHLRRYVCAIPNIDLGKIATDHYLHGKKEAAHYLQAGDDFYLIGKGRDSDPLGLQDYLGKPIPVMAGMGNFKVRVATRSSFIEVQPEVKIAAFTPPYSPFSALKDTQKVNPFKVAAEAKRKK